MTTSPTITPEQWAEWQPLLERAAREKLSSRRHWAQPIGREAIQRVCLVPRRTADELRDRWVASPKWAEMLHAERKRRANPSLGGAVEVPELVELNPPGEDAEPIEDLLRRKLEEQNRRLNAVSKHDRTIELPPQPAGFLVYGDPHLDNKGCDLALLLHHTRLARAHGLYAISIGDNQDHWVGRLGKLYASNSTTASEGWRLFGAWVAAQRWLAIVGGNHDSWSHAPGVDPYAVFCKLHKVPCYAPDELRIALDFGVGAPVRWLLRHDVRGRSWFHPTHGPHKAAMMDPSVDIVTAGHTHNWGYLTTEQRGERVTHAFRCRGYKRLDPYAMEKGFHEQRHGAAALVLVDPHRTGPGRITVHWDIEHGCEVLEMMRARAAEGVAA